MLYVAQKVDQALKAMFSGEAFEDRLKEAAGHLTVINNEPNLGRLGQETKDCYHAFFQAMDSKDLHEAARQLRFFVMEALGEVEGSYFLEAIRREEQSLSVN